jgi:hypothetical protein
MIPINKERPSEEILLPNISFIGEQKGAPEDKLKNALINFFQRDKSVAKAYLAKIGGGQNVNVALCLRTQFGIDRGMVEKIGTIFATVFNSKEHLDIIFLNDHQEKDIVKVCQPFFEKLLHE